MLRKIVLILTLVCALPVFANAASWYVTAATSPSAGGSISNSGRKTYDDTTTSASYSITVNPGYSVSAVRLDGAMLTATPVNGSSFDGNKAIIAKKTGYQNLVVYFAAKKYSISVTQTTGGTISAIFTNPLNALVGRTAYTFKVSAKDNYKINSVLVDGNPVALDSLPGFASDRIGTYTFEPLTGNHTISATYVAYTYGTPSVHVMGQMVKDKVVRFNGSLSSNEKVSSYGFAVTGPNGAVPVTQDPTDPTVATCVPTADGTYTVTFTAVTALKPAGYTATADFTINTAAAVVNACASCHINRTNQVIVNYQANRACTDCHVPNNTSHNGGDVVNARAFYGSKHATNATNNRMNADGTPSSCATTCHFNNQVQTNVAGCQACHSGALQADGTFVNASSALKVHGTVDTPDFNLCLVCHSGSKHGGAADEFFASKHWNNSTESGPEFANQGMYTVNGATVTQTGTQDGILEPNDSYTTTEDGTVVTCAYRCHFRPGMGPQANVDGVLADRKATSNISYVAPNGAKYSRYGGDACVACHDPHGLTANARSTCYTCHSGSKHGATTVNFEKSSHNNGKYAKMDGMDQEACLACHNPHSTEAVFFTMSSANGVDTGLVKSDTGCQKCHAPGASYSVYSSTRMLKGAHAPIADNAFNATASYQTTDGSTCVDCHGHDNTVNAGWAKGGHGDITAVPWKSDSGHTWNAQGPATNGVSYQSSPQQTNCIRCHTARGFAQFVDSNFTNIDQIKLADGTVSKASSPLTCKGCHLNPDNRDAAGFADKGLRMASMAAGYNALYGYSSASIAPKKIVTGIQLINNKNSNVCMPCHSQRASGQEIKDLFAAGAFKQYSVGSAMYPHAAQPAAVWSGKGGYEFTSAQGYQDRMNHTRIGNGYSGPAKNTYSTTGYNDTGVTQGSCVGCHMSSDETHSLEINDASFKNTCYKCHPKDFVQSDLDAKAADFDAAVTALGKLLVQKGITLDGINPLPERKAKDMSLGTKNNATAEKNIGAWFNWYLFSTADKAAYAHNPAYARRLIFDSIDWLDDNTMNNSSATSILKLATAAGNNVLTLDQAQKAAAFTNDPGCMGCHFGTGSTANGEAVPGVEQAPHFNTNGTFVPGNNFTQAQFVVPGTQCNYCHGYGHGTDSPSYSFSTTAYPNAAVAGAKPSLIGEYGESAHGDINGLAWTDYDFKTRTDCVACHTTTGFVTAVNSNYTNTAAFGVAGDDTKQVLGCNACHSSTNWKSSIRSVNLNSLGVISPISYDNAGESNVCIPCHATRENTTTVNAVADASYSNLAFKNPHYLGAAAVFYGKGGFQFYTSGVRYNTYGAAGKVGHNANWSHGRLGMDNYTTTTNATVKASGVVVDSGNKGQCVACHLGPTNTHTFGALETANATRGTSTYTRGCYGCHTGTDMDMATFVEEEKVIWDRMMDFFSYTLKQNNIRYTEAYPYFQYDKTQNGVTAGGQLKNWTYPATGPNGGTGKQTMGAALNYKLLAAEPGKHVHNRSFGRALIADSIVYLQKGSVGDRTVVSADVNGVINFSNYSAANPVGNGVSISTLKGYLTKSATGGFVRR